MGEKVNLTKDIDDIILHEDKKLNDRTNILIQAQAFLFAGIATLLADFNLTSWHRVIPIVICCTGIALNIIWGRSNNVQIRKTTESIETLAKTKKHDLLAEVGTLNVVFSPVLKKTEKNELKLSDFVSQWMPFILSLGWIFVLTFYILYFFIQI